MRRYSWITALMASFFSKDLYRDVAHSWSGIGFLYLVLLCALTWAPLIARQHVQVTQAAQRDWPQIVKNFPEIKLEKGQVSSTVPQPFIVMDDSRPPKPGFVLDTTGQIKSFEDTPAAILVTRTRVFFRDRGNKQERAFDLKEVPDLTVNAAKLVDWGNSLARWFGPLAFTLMVCASVAWGMAAMMVLAVFGAMIGGSRSTVSTGGYLRLAAVSRTPGMLLGLLVSFFSLDVGAWTWFLVACAISLAYMAYAVACANETPAKPFDTVVPPPPEPFTQTTEPQQPSCFTPPE